MGITKEIKDNLFTVKDSDTKEETQKKGMGLKLVKDFIEKHGCSIVAESELGKGSLFNFTIPRSDP